MSKEKCTITHLETVSHRAKRAYRKNGPKSYKKGQGALLKVLHKDGGSATRDELIERLGFNRRELKDAVRKAEKNGFATIDGKGKDGYTVKITAAGEELAEKRCAAQAKVAKDMLSALSADEVEQLDSLLVKVIKATGNGDKPSGKMHHRRSRKHSCKRHCKRS